MRTDLLHEGHGNGAKVVGGNQGTGDVAAGGGGGTRASGGHGGSGFGGRLG